MGITEAHSIEHAELRDRWEQKHGSGYAIFHSEIRDETIVIGDETFKLSDIEQMVINNPPERNNGRYHPMVEQALDDVRTFFAKQGVK